MEEGRGGGRERWRERGVEGVRGGGRERWRERERQKERRVKERGVEGGRGVEGVRGGGSERWRE